jgi:hypothetical protein
MNTTCRAMTNLITPPRVLAFRGTTAVEVVRAGAAAALAEVVDFLEELAVAGAAAVAAAVAGAVDFLDELSDLLLPYDRALDSREGIIRRGDFDVRYD